MKNNTLKIIGSLLGLGMLLTITPVFVAAEEEKMPLSIDIDVLSEDSENAEILDVDVNNLLGIDNVDVKIPNSEENTEELASVSIADEKVGNIEADILTYTETSQSNEQAVIDIAIDNVPLVNDIDAEVLKHKENELIDSHSSESAVAAVAVEELLIKDDVNVEVLTHEEGTLANGSSNNEAVVQATIDDLIITDQVELNVLKTEESLWDQSQKETQQGAHLKLNNLPLLETLHVGVLENQFIKKNHSQQEDSSVITVGLGAESSLTNSLIDEVELNVLENSQYTGKNFQAENSAVVGLELNDTSLGDLSTYVLLSESTIDKGNRMNNSGLLEVNTDDLLLLEDTHIGVLDRHIEEDGEALSLSEGVLQLDLISDLTDEISIDVLTNDEFTNNSGTNQKGKTISIGLINDLVGEISVDILPTENFVAATSKNLMPPTENVVEVVEDNEGEDGTSEEINTEDTPVTNEEGDSAEDQNSSYDEEIIVVEDEGTESTDTMVQNPAVTEDDESSLGANFNNNDGDFFTGSSLPQTGGIFTGMMLLIIALSLLGSGWTIRKLA